MPTIKLVVIGSSGVGKTSFRSQYISGRFSTGYRATIGADFITKTFPHPTRPDGEDVTLQIWDTAGQERFSSLSNAFFRGADAALFMFDVNQPRTLADLGKWWCEFKERAPLRDEDVARFCAVVVGNKVDLPPGADRVSVEDAERFMRGMVPVPAPEGATSPLGSPLHFDVVSPTSTNSDVLSDEIPIPFPRPRTRSIDLSPPSALSSSSATARRRSRSLVYGGTLTSTATVYHTPSSSFFDGYDAGRSSSDASSGVTLTQSLFARERAASRGGAGAAPVTGASTPPRVASPDIGPRLFWTSAKTGEGVKSVFEYIAKRVIGVWEWEEAAEDRVLHVQEASMGETVRIGLDVKRDRKGGCCT